MICVSVFVFEGHFSSIMMCRYCSCSFHRVPLQGKLAFRAGECFGLALATEIWCCTLRSMHRWHFSANCQHSTPGFKRILASLQSSKPACNCLMPLSSQGGTSRKVV